MTAHCALHSNHPSSDEQSAHTHIHTLIQDFGYARLSPKSLQTIQFDDNSEEKEEFNEKKRMHKILIVTV